jgi:hypothetical protein
VDALIDEGTAVSAAPVTAPPFDIADEIAEAVGGPVIVEDASFRVVGYSAFVGPMDRGRVEAILGRHIPPAWLAHLTETGSLDRLRSTRDVVDLRDGPWQAHRRLITAFRAGERVLGFAWVAEGERPLGDGAAAALRRAVDDATPRLLRHLEQIDAAQAHAFREVDALLDGLPGAPAVAARLGLDRAGRFAVLAVSATGSPETDALALRLVEHLRLCLGSLRRRAAFTAHGDRALAVVALTEDDTADAARRLAGDVVRLAGKGPLHPLQAAVSSVGHGVASVPVLRDQALAAASVHAGTGGCIAFADVEAEVLVAEVVASLPPATRLEGLDRLREADRGSGELERTLRAYLAACGSASGAARDLGVHVTTVRHRLDRITTVSGLRLDRPDVRVACELMLRRAGA